VKRKLHNSIGYYTLSLELKVIVASPLFTLISIAKEHPFWSEGDEFRR